MCILCVTATTAINIFGIISAE